VHVVLAATDSSETKKASSRIPPPRRVPGTTYTASLSRSCKSPIDTSDIGRVSRLGVSRVLGFRRPWGPVGRRTRLSVSPLPTSSNSDREFADGVGDSGGDAKSISSSSPNPPYVSLPSTSSLMPAVTGVAVVDVSAGVFSGCGPRAYRTRKHRVSSIRHMQIFMCRRAQRRAAVLNSPAYHSNGLTGAPRCHCSQ
jgi:hypothetical protein